MTEVTDLFFDLEKQNIDISKLSEITLTEEYDRRRDQPDDFLHIKNTISFSNLNSSYLISRYKEFTYEYDVLPDADEGDTFTTRQGIITFTETENLLGNTSRMSISDFLASDFTVVEEAEREAAPDVPVEHFEAEAEVETVNVPPEHNASNSQNFVITDENLGVKTPKARFAANVEAIRTLNAIEAEHRTATPKEQAVLSGYTGWGAIPQAFDSDNKDWSNEYAELKELLTDDEYMAARRSTRQGEFTRTA